MDIVLDVWGDYACFSRPEAKVERMSYPVPTPSAIRGFLSGIYSKPPEFYWQVRRIEVMKPIQFISFKRNEVKGKLGRTPIEVEDERTQRQTGGAAGRALPYHRPNCAKARLPERPRTRWIVRQFAASSRASASSSPAWA